MNFILDPRQPNIIPVNKPNISLRLNHANCGMNYEVDLASSWKS